MSYSIKCIHCELGVKVVVGVVVIALLSVLSSEGALQASGWRAQGGDSILKS